MKIAHQFKLTSLRECPLPDDMALGDTPDKIAQYWRENAPKMEAFNPDVECLVVVLLNTRRRILGHILVSTGTLDTILCHPREVFRPAIIQAAAAIVMVHNHPSGDPTPSEADIKVTREIMRAGQILKIELLDHLIMGTGKHVSLRELGYFYSA